MNSQIEVPLETDRNIFADLQSTRSFIRGKIFEDDRTRLDNIEATSLIKNALQSFFYNFEVFLSKERVHIAKSVYAYQTFVSAEFSGTKGTKQNLSNCQ